MATDTTSHQQELKKALVEQVTHYIAKYTPNPSLITYSPNPSGDVMGRFESQGRVFTFRLSNKGLVYKPLVQRKDNETDESYALRFDTGSSIYLDHFAPKHTNTQALDRKDALKAFKPKPTVSVGNAPKKRGTKAQPNCSAISYHCGVCISLGKNCIKNANTAVLKERLGKINSLSRMAAKGQAVPQVKTGVIGARTDPKSLMKKAQGQAREFAKTQDKAISPKEYEFLAGKKKPSERDLAELNNSDNKFATLIAREIYASGDKNLIQKWSGRKRISSGFDTSIQKAILKDHDDFREKNNVPSGMSLGEWKAGQDKKLKTKAKQSALRAAAEPNKTTTLATPYPLTAQAQKRLERGESISDNETYAVHKKGDKYLVTDPNKFEDEGKLVDKAGLASHLKELEAQPREAKKSSSMNPPIPITKDPDMVLRALRNGRLVGDAKQGYEIQEHPTQKGDYLITTMPNKNGDYSGVLTKKELVSFVKGGGDGSRFNKEQPIDPPLTGAARIRANTERKQREKYNIPSDVSVSDFLEQKRAKETSEAEARKAARKKTWGEVERKDYPEKSDYHLAQIQALKDHGSGIITHWDKNNTPIADIEKSIEKDRKQADKLSLQGMNQMSGNGNRSTRKAVSQFGAQKLYNSIDEQEKYLAARKGLESALNAKKEPPIPLTSGKNLTPSQKKQSRKPLSELDKLQAEASEIKRGKKLLSSDDQKRLNEISNKIDDIDFANRKPKPHDELTNKLLKGEPVKFKDGQGDIRTMKHENGITTITHPTKGVVYKEKESPRDVDRMAASIHSQQNDVDRTRSDLSNATKRINTLDDSIKKLKAGKGVMSEADLKKVGALERQKADWVEARDKHQAKLSQLSKQESTPITAKREQLPEAEKDRLIRRAKDAPRHYEKIMQDHLDPDGVPLFGSDGVSILTKSAPPSAYDSSAVGISGRNGLAPTFLSQKTKELDNKFSSLYNKQKQSQGRNTPVFNDEMKKLEKEAQESFLKDYAVAKESGIVAAKKGVDEPQKRKDDATDNIGSDRILSYITDNSGNMMGIAQIRGIRYRFLKPVFGSVVLTPVSDTNLAYLFDLAPDLTLPQGDPLSLFNEDSKVLISR